MALTNKGVKGDTKAAMAFCGLAMRLLDQGEASGEEETLDGDDLAILEAYTKRKAEPVQPPKDEPTSDDNGGDASAAPSEEDPS